MTSLRFLYLMRWVMDIAVKIKKTPNFDLLEYVGPINEESEVHLGNAIGNLGPTVKIDFAKVEYVNSCGVRAWINFLRELERDRQVEFANCTPEIVTQMNMIPSFKGRAIVSSVFGNYTCSVCDNKKVVLFEKDKTLPSGDGEINLPGVKCNKCGDENMELDELEDEYFAFNLAG